MGRQISLVPELRNKRQHTIDFLNTSLMHTSACSSADCKAPHCVPILKRVLKHAGGCTTKASGGCGICKRLWALVVEHVLLREGKGSDHANVIDGKEGWDCHDTVLGCGSYCHRDGGSAVCSQFLRLDLNREQPFITQSI